MVGIFLLADPIQRNLQPFKQLYVKEGIEVVLIKGTEYNAMVDVSGCNPADVLTEVNNGRLTIRMRPNGRYRNIEVKVALTYVNPQCNRCVLGQEWSKDQIDWKVKP